MNHLARNSNSSVHGPLRRQTRAGVLGCALLLSLLAQGCAKQAPNQTSTHTDTSVAVDVNGVAKADQANAAVLASLRLTDVHGQNHDPLEEESAKGFVLVFVATDCPIANYYQPKLSMMTTDYASDDVLFFLVYSDPDLQQQEAIKHAEEFKAKAPVIIDSDQSLAKLVNAKVTPEAFLIDREGNVKYGGRIDNLYADYGKRRQQPTTSDLKDAIESLVRGETLPSIRTKAIGCYIPYPNSLDDAQP